MSCRRFDDRTLALPLASPDPWGACGKAALSESPPAAEHGGQSDAGPVDGHGNPKHGGPPWIARGKRHPDPAAARLALARLVSKGWGLRAVAAALGVHRWTPVRWARGIRRASLRAVAELHRLAAEPAPVASLGASPLARTVAAGLLRAGSWDALAAAVAVRPGTLARWLADDLTPSAKHPGPGRLAAWLGVPRPPTPKHRHRDRRPAGDRTIRDGFRLDRCPCGAVRRVELHPWGDVARYLPWEPATTDRPPLSPDAAP